MGSEGNGANHRLEIIAHAASSGVFQDVEELRRGRLTYLAKRDTFPKYQWVFQRDRRSSSNSIVKIARSSSVTPAVREVSTISVTWIGSQIE